MGWTKLVTTKRNWQECQKAHWLRQKPRLSERAGRLFADAGYPKLLAGMTYCDNQALREEMYRAYSTRLPIKARTPVSGTTAR